MIYEPSSLVVDVEKLRAYFQEKVCILPPVMQSADFGGWSILSSTGSYTDGWQPGHLCYKTVAGRVVWDHNIAARIGAVPNSEHRHPTQVCTEYVQRVIDMIRAQGLEPCRARWSILKAHGESTLHRDGLDGAPIYRLHIPVVTNRLCTFEADGLVEHVPADGRVWFVRVNRLHQIFNRSGIDRVHIIMNVRNIPR